MKSLENLLRNNREWAARIKKDDPGFFERLGEHQSPDYLWIGCADSRVDPATIVGLKPGELFVHRNIANVVVLSDLNALSVIQYAVEALKVKDIIVCGHYGCGGVRAAMLDSALGLAENWLQHIRGVQEAHAEELAVLKDEDARFRRLCELNVLEQVRNVSRTAVVRKAWRTAKDLTVHGWIYGIEDGLVHDLHLKVSSSAESAKATTLKKERFRSRPD
jgi:carbonic anhydrase